jgi:hypothetical protein
MDVTKRKHRRGRPIKADRLTLATDYLVRCLPAETVGRVHGVHRATVFRAVSWVLASDDPAAREIQAVCGSK